MLLNESELLDRCEQIQGLTFIQLAAKMQITIPNCPKRRKGFMGLAIENALGTTAGNKALPDFHHLGIELKTIPINHLGKPAESTFICSISLIQHHKETWPNSLCYKKLKRILWVPVEDYKTIAFEDRRIGTPFLWSPSSEEEAVIKEDWNELSTMIIAGRLEEINASMGNYLQVRPKCQNARSLCYGFDSEGNKIQTLPRGFYLRSRFTAQVLTNSS